jgi:undecaprenyl-diphosphatase
MYAWLESGRSLGAATDLRYARALNQRAALQPRLQRACWWCSRAGDGLPWTLALLPLCWFDPAAARVAFTLGLVNLVLYWTLKRATRRMRPCTRWQDFVAGECARDRYSFPSGHTLHAASFAVLLSAWEPLLGPLLALFAAGVGMSRVLLGVHYPSDVLAGAALGAATAAVAVQALP